MSAQRFKPGQTFHWGGELYEVRQLLSDGRLNIVNQRTGAGQAVALSTLVAAIVADTLAFVSLSEAEPLVGPGPVELTDYTEEQRAVAEYRLAIIQPCLDLPAQGRRQAIRDQVQATRAQRPTNEHSLLTVVSVTSVYRWLKVYLQSGRDLRALMPQTDQRGGSETTRLVAEVEAILTATIDDLYYVREYRSIDYIHREVTVRITEENQRRRPEDHLPLPSRATVGRRLMGLTVQTTLAAKQGRRAARRELSQYQATPYPTLPLERVEIDHTRTDLVVVDETDYLPLGRLTLTYGLDTATRYPLGYYLGFEPPSYLAVMSCLYHAICPKPEVRTRYGTQHDWLAFGIPYGLVVDNGKEFLGRDLEDACQLLGMVLHQTPLKTPHFKAAVERLFGTTNTGLLHTLPGTTFSHPQQRGDYDSVGQACITLHDLEQMLHLFLLDIYAEDFHRGLQAIPARRWEQLTQSGFFPRVPASATELRILLGRVAYRTIHPYGLELYGLRYNDDALTDLRRRMQRRDAKQVKVKYDPTDLSRIYLYDPDEQRYLTVAALAQDYTQGLSLWKHQVIRNFVLSQQKTVDLVALGQAQRQIQATVEESLHRKHLQTRTKIARWQQAGQPGRTGDQPDIIPDPSPPQTTPPALDFDLNLEPGPIQAERWEVSDPLPGTSPGGRSA